MTRPSTLTLAVSLLLPFSIAWAERSGVQETPLQALGSSFKSHQVGQPFLDQGASEALAVVCRNGKTACDGFKETLLKARDVQEGCAGACESPQDIEIYRAKIGVVCEDLGMDPAAFGAAADNYIKDRVPRKKPAGTTSSPELDPKLRAELKDRALQLAESLGHLKWVDGNGDSVVAAKEPLGRAAGPLPGGAAAPQPPAKTMPVPIPLREVEGRFRASLNAQIARFPTGAAVLKAAEPLPPVRFERIKDENGNSTLGYYENSSGKLTFNSERLASIIKELDPAAAKLPLEEVAALKNYLSRNPDVFPKLAAQLDVLYVHELTHRGQHVKSGDNLVDNTVNGWKRILSGNKYPIEHEWEAFGNQNKYFNERARKEPDIVDLKHSPEFGIFEYEDYVKDLQAYRRSKAALYQGDADTMDKLRFFKKDKPAQDRILAQEAREWPRVSYEGNMNLARHWAGFKSPENSLGYLATALDRASKNGFLAEVKPEMTEFFKSVVGKYEALLAADKPGTPARVVRGPAKEALAILSPALGVPIPPRLAAAADLKKP